MFIVFFRLSYAWIKSWASCIALTARSCVVVAMMRLTASPGSFEDSSAASPACLASVLALAHALKATFSASSEGPARNAVATDSQATDGEVSCAAASSTFSGSSSETLCISKGCSFTTTLSTKTPLMKASRSGIGWLVSGCRVAASVAATEATSRSREGHLSRRWSLDLQKLHVLDVPFPPGL